MTASRAVPRPLTTRLTLALAVTGLAAAACGSTAASDPVSPGGGATPTSPTSPTQNPPAPPNLQSYADELLGRVQVPPTAQRSAQAPSKALAGLPEEPALSGKPTVRSRFWTVDLPAAAVYACLGRHDGDLGPEGTVGSISAGDTPVDPVWSSPTYRTYAAQTPAGIAVAQLYVGVVAIDANRTAVAAYAVTLAQPTRPDAEVVPTTGVRAVIGWELAPGGTPARKVLSGAAAATLARDFNALRVSSKGQVACPLIPQGAGTLVTVTFSAGGHTWHAAIPVCPSIAVTRDGARMPALDFGQPFLRDVKTYAGHLPWDGPLAGGGPITPLGAPVRR